MRIGILGGTFDPPHLAHLALAEAALSSLELDEVMFIPAKKNPQKAKQPEASAKQRLHMTTLLANMNPKFTVCDLEINRKGPSYMIDTLDELHLVRPGDYWLIMGSDAAKTFPEWKKADRIVNLCRLAVAVRPPANQRETLRGLPDWVKDRADVIDMPISDISATKIRHRLEEGLSTLPFLTPDVLQYIREQHLYGAE